MSLHHKKNHNTSNLLLPLHFRGADQTHRVSHDQFAHTRQIQGGGLSNRDLGRRLPPAPRATAGRETRLKIRVGIHLKMCNSFLFIIICRFFFRSSLALYRWSSTQILPDYWGTFCAGGLPNVQFSLVQGPGLEPGQAQSQQAVPTP